MGPFGCASVPWPGARERRGRGLDSNQPFTHSATHSTSLPVGSSCWEPRTHSQETASGGGPQEEPERGHLSPDPPAPAQVGSILLFLCPIPACITAETSFTPASCLDRDLVKDRVGGGSHSPCKPRVRQGAQETLHKSSQALGRLGGSAGEASDFSGHDLPVCEFEPRVGLAAVGTEPALDPRCPPLCLCPPPLSRVLSCSQK